MFQRALSPLPGSGGEYRIDYLVPDGASGLPSDYIATASSSYAGYPPYRGFSRSGAGWAPSSAGAGWLKIQLPKEMLLSGARLSNNTGVSVSATLEGSNDDINYTTITTFSNTGGSTFAVIQENSSKYKFYKLSSSSLSIAGAGYTLALFGVVDD